MVSSYVRLNEMKILGIVGILAALFVLYSTLDLSSFHYTSLRHFAHRIHEIKDDPDFDGNDDTMVEVRYGDAWGALRTYDMKAKDAEQLRSTAQVTAGILLLMSVILVVNNRRKRVEQSHAEPTSEPAQSAAPEEADA